MRIKFGETINFYEGYSIFIKTTKTIINKNYIRFIMLDCHNIHWHWNLKDKRVLIYFHKHESLAIYMKDISNIKNKNME